ncbi:hypothetical protein KJI95_01595 [Shewanella sp. JM162201]|uniref:Uncharacterized protein n=1 Tax=Shewanella jiangmenensis TaxID=2837387 RepID=A0ABS5V0T7_9GAMM|nr:hypothetical protein [Shewanella jiangmenensis]MBT1443221.1 hypothetical protein [Shewanella jiangmenensis]
MNHKIVAILPAALLALLLSTLFPANAWAFDRSGSITTMVLILGLGSFTLLNLISQFAFYLSGFYRSARFARRHVILSLLPVAAAVLFVILNAQHFGGLMMDMGLVLVALALALLPLLVADKPAPERPWVSLLAAALMLAAGFVVAPITAFALILAHVSLNYLKGHSRFGALLIIAIGYPFLGVYLYQFIGKLG